jgi:hypothetical protein
MAPIVIVVTIHIVQISPEVAIYIDELFKKNEGLLFQLPIGLFG